jgi:hypothetical protein
MDADTEFATVTTRSRHARHSRRARRHGQVLQQVDRRAMERAGWRTMLSYLENHTRAWDGTLLSVTTVWVAEAEHADHAGAARASSVQVRANSADEAWALLRRRTTEIDRRGARVRMLLDA